MDQGVKAFRSQIGGAGWVESFDWSLNRLFRPGRSLNTCVDKNLDRSSQQRTLPEYDQYLRKTHLCLFLLRFSSEACLFLIHCLNHPKLILCQHHWSRSRYIVLSACPDWMGPRNWSLSHKAIHSLVLRETMGFWRCETPYETWTNKCTIQNPLFILLNNQTYHIPSRVKSPQKQTQFAFSCPSPTPKSPSNHTWFWASASASRPVFSNQWQLDQTDSRPRTIARDFYLSKMGFHLIKIKLKAEKHIQLIQRLVPNRWSEVVGGVQILGFIL